MASAHPMDFSKRKTLNEPWEDIGNSTLLSPRIETSHWEQIVLFPNTKEDDYVIEVDLTLLEGEVLHKQLYKEAGVLLRYSGENQYYYAGLGGFGARTFIGRVKQQEGASVWSCLDSQGTKDEIKFDRNYRLRVECRGDTISLIENDKNRYSVDVDPSSTGCWGLRTVRTQARFSTIKKSSPSMLVALVIMPFTTSLNFVYQTINEVVSAEEIICHRVDKSSISTPIIEDIKEWLTNADLIIADLTDVNPNVYYEAGYAHALRKKLILMAQEGTDLAFNMQHIRTLFYSDPEDLRKKLKKAIDETLAAERGRERNPGS
jgi:hypothetical protein